MTEQTKAILIHEDLFSCAIEDGATGQIYLTHDEDLPPETLKAIWGRFEIGYEVVSQHYDFNEERECFVIDRIKP